MGKVGTESRGLMKGNLLLYSSKLPFIGYRATAGK